MRYFAIFLTFVLVGCLNTGKEPPEPIPFDSTQQPYELYQNLIRQLAYSLNQGDKLSSLESPIVTTSFVWVSDYKLSQDPASFGHLGLSLEEALSTELVQQDVQIKEYKVRPSIYVDQEGGYFLSRDKEQMQDRIQARYILVGTLSPLQSGASVNAKVIDYQGGDVISSANVFFPYKSQYTRTVNMVNGAIVRGEN